MNVVTFQSYEARIDALQKQVEEQSMTMSMYSSYTPEDFNNEEDIFGQYQTPITSIFNATGRYFMTFTYTPVFATADRY